MASQMPPPPIDSQQTIGASQTMPQTAAIPSHEDEDFDLDPNNAANQGTSKNPPGHLGDTILAEEEAAAQKTRPRTSTFSRTGRELPLHRRVPLISKDGLDLRFLLKSAEDNNGEPETDNPNSFFYAGYDDFKYKTTSGSQKFVEKDMKNFFMMNRRLLATHGGLVQDYNSLAQPQVKIMVDESALQESRAASEKYKAYAYDWRKKYKDQVKWTTEELERMNQRLQDSQDQLRQTREGRTPHFQDSTHHRRNSLSPSPDPPERRPLPRGILPAPHGLDPALDGNNGLRRDHRAGSYHTNASRPSRTTTGSGRPVRIPDPPLFDGNRAKFLQ
ncbi:hypothetical protein LTR70_010704 [Exophiala xenobiotica]|uniref:Uncharacterized protein n=1 Tax=Lithohypha guttulata TaxID=1690604 RepID=A0ABR0JTF2_9EURO|nr:hypothetical protein LTR24_010686 [Lithohypha guttulata]KAK5308962.1 hypothetical protein LTR70_010704 [Exophiala xenobiotica]